MADEKITWSCAVQVAGGPTVSSSDACSSRATKVAPRDRGQQDRRGEDRRRRRRDAGCARAEQGERQADVQHGSNDVKLDRAQVLAGEVPIQYIRTHFPI